ncbi:hypothetical protein Tco_1545736, partial [Tanacetum coccineum]
MPNQGLLGGLENPDLGTFTEEEITDEFPDEHLMIFKVELNSDEPWYADYVNYTVGKIVPPNWTLEKRRRFFAQVKNYFWDEPYAFKLCSDNVMRRCVARNEIHEILAHCHSGPTGGYHNASITGRKFGIVEQLSGHLPIVTTSRYVVPTGRVKVPAGRYVVPTGKDNVIVSVGRTKVIPVGKTIFVL